MTFRRLKRKFIRFLFREQWSLLICEASGKILKEIIPPPDRIWADPFPVEHDGRLLIFIEQQIAGGHGTLGYIEVSREDLSFSEFHQILDTGYHLSWPNVFRHAVDGREVWFMMPESHSNGTIDLYRATSFPDAWKHELTLMNGVSAADPELIFHDGTWWLFASLSSDTMGPNDSLSLFYADRFPTDQWSPFSGNPVALDKDNSRMGGKIFRDGETGCLMRPAQSCKRQYGDHLVINKIVSLDHAGYSEERAFSVFPERSINAVCTHTYNRVGDYLVRDVKKRHFRSSFNLFQ